MARSDDFNPKAVLVVKHAKGLKMGGREYEQGDPVKDDCISLRKRHQLFRQNILCYPHELEAILEANKQGPTEEEIAAAEEAKRLEAEKAQAEQEEADRLAAEEAAELARSTQPVLNENDEVMFDPTVVVSDEEAAEAAADEGTQSGDENTQEGDAAETVEVPEEVAEDKTEEAPAEPVQSARGRRRARKPAE